MTRTTKFRGLAFVSAIVLAIASQIAFGEPPELDTDEQQLRYLLYLRRQIPNLFSEAATYDVDLFDLLSRQNNLRKQLQELGEYQTLQQDRPPLRNLQFGVEGTREVVSRRITPEAIRDWRGQIFTALRLFEGSRDIGKDIEKRIAQRLNELDGLSLTQYENGLILTLPKTVQNYARSLTDADLSIFLEQNLPEDVLGAGFQPERFEMDRKGFNKAQALKHLREILRKENEIRLLTQLHIVLQDSAGAIEPTYDSAINKIHGITEQTLDYFLDRITFAARMKSLFSREALASVDDSARALSGTVRRGINEVTKKTTSAVSTVSGTVHVEEVPPDVGILGGFVMGNCATQFSFGYPNSPREHRYHIYPGEGIPLEGISGANHTVRPMGGIVAVRAKVNGEPVLYINTVDGHVINPAQAQLVLDGLHLSLKELGVKHIVLANKNISGRINNSGIASLVEDLVRGKPEVQVAFEDTEVRSIIDGAVISSGYDSTSYNTTGVIYTPEPKRLEGMQHRSNLTKVVPYDSTHHISRADMLLFAIDSRRAGRTETARKVIEMGNLGEDDVQRVDTALANAGHKPVAEYQQAVEHSLRSLDPSGSRVLEGRGYLLLPGLMSSPDAFEPAHRSQTLNLIAEALLAERLDSDTLKKAVDVGTDHLRAHSMTQYRLKRRLGKNLSDNDTSLLYLSQALSDNELGHLIVDTLSHAAVLPRTKMKLLGTNYRTGDNSTLRRVFNANQVPLREYEEDLRLLGEQHKKDWGPQFLQENRLVFFQGRVNASDSFTSHQADTIENIFALAKMGEEEVMQMLNAIPATKRALLQDSPLFQQQLEEFLESGIANRVPLSAAQLLTPLASKKKAIEWVLKFVADPNKPERVQILANSFVESHHLRGDRELEHHLNLTFRSRRSADVFHGALQLGLATPSNAGELLRMAVDFEGHRIGEYGATKKFYEYDGRKHYYDSEGEVDFSQRLREGIIQLATSAACRSSLSCTRQIKRILREQLGEDTTRKYVGHRLIDLAHSVSRAIQQDPEWLKSPYLSVIGPELANSGAKATAGWYPITMGFRKSDTQPSFDMMEAFDGKFWTAYFQRADLPPEAIVGPAKILILGPEQSSRPAGPFVFSHWLSHEMRESAVQALASVGDRSPEAFDTLLDISKMQVPSAPVMGRSWEEAISRKAMETARHLAEDDTDLAERAIKSWMELLNYAAFQSELMGINESDSVRLVDLVKAVSSLARRNPGHYYPKVLPQLFLLLHATARDTRAENHLPITFGFNIFREMALDPNNSNIARAIVDELKRMALNEPLIVKYIHDNLLNIYQEKHFNLGDSTRTAINDLRRNYPELLEEGIAEAEYQRRALLRHRTFSGDPNVRKAAIAELIGQVNALSHLRSDHDELRQTTAFSIHHAMNKLESVPIGGGLSQGMADYYRRKPSECEAIMGSLSSFKKDTP